MHERSKTIEDWIGTLKATHLYSASDLNELKSHLVEEIESLMSSGLSDEEALLVAQHRIGSAPVLNEEYAKVNTSRTLLRVVYFLLTGYLTVLALAGLLKIFSFAVYIFGRTMNLDLASASTLVILSNVSLFVMLCVLAFSQGPMVRWFRDLVNKSVGFFERHPFVFLCMVVLCFPAEMISNTLFARFMNHGELGNLSLTIFFINMAWLVILAGIVAALTKMRLHERTFA